MNKLSIGIISAVLLVSIFSFASFMVAAQDSSNDSLGLPSNESAVPSGLGRAIERLTLLLTFNKAAKAEKGLDNARTRLLEVRSMIEQKRFGEANKSRAEFESDLNEVSKRLDQIKDDNNPKKEVENKCKIEKKLAEREEDVERLETEIELKVDGNITNEQTGAIDSLIESFRNETGKLRLKLDSEQGDVKLRIKAKFGLNDSDADNLLNETCAKFNVTKGYVRASEAAINRSSIIIGLAEKRLNEVAALNNSKINLTKAYSLLAEAKDLLAQARNASANGEYQRAIEFANKAKARVLKFVHARIAFNEKQLEKAIERTEKVKGRLEEIKNKTMEKREELRNKLEERRNETEKNRNETSLENSNKSKSKNESE